MERQEHIEVLREYVDQLEKKKAFKLEIITIYLPWLQFSAIWDEILELARGLRNVTFSLSYLQHLQINSMIHLTILGTYPSL